MSMSIVNSLALHSRAQKVIPGAAQVISKEYRRLVQGVSPSFMSWGYGCRVWDVDDNEYIDWSASLGPVVLGYGMSSSVNAGECCLPLPNFKEVELAEKLHSIIPCAEMVRFFKTGSDATSAAVRLSRFITGRSNVVTIGYHGWHDWYASTLPEPKNGGCIDDYVFKFPYGDLDKLTNFCNTLEVPACVIMEPLSRECPEKAHREYLLKVQEFCNDYGIVLVFDEIIMGFRYAMAGGQEYYGVTPDLATYSKAMANGYPISCLVGRRDLMEELPRLQISGTFFGDVMGMTAALNTINYMQKHQVIARLWEVGSDMCTGINSILYGNNIQYVRLKGFGPWSSFVWAEDALAEQHFFMQETVKRGIFYNRDHFAMYAHMDKDIDDTLKVYNDVFNEINALRLRGELQLRLEGKFERSY